MRVRPWRILTPPARPGAHRPSSVAATAGVWMGMRGAEGAPPVICAAPAGGRQCSFCERAGLAAALAQ